MAIRCISDEELDVPDGGKDSQKVSQRIYEGPITEKEVAAAQKNPEAFLKKNKVKFSRDAQIHVETHRFGGQPANRPASAGLTAGLQRGWLCRVTVIVIDGYVIVRVVCVPVIIIVVGPQCW